MTENLKIWIWRICRKNRINEFVLFPQAMKTVGSNSDIRKFWHQIRANIDKISSLVRPAFQMGFCNILVQVLGVFEGFGRRLFRIIFCVYWKDLVSIYTGSEWRIKGNLSPWKYCTEHAPVRCFEFLNTMTSRFTIANWKCQCVLLIYNLECYFGM